MEKSEKQKLIDLGAKTLAEALLDLAAQSDAVDETVDRLIATPKENVTRFKRKLAGLKRSKRFIDWRGITGFARDLRMLLENLRAGVSDPLTGVQMVAAFYGADAATLGRCDDSSGYVGDIFRYDAKELFLEYARGCDDEKKMADIILKLNRKDDYGVRDTLVYCAGEYLSEPVIRTMISKLEKRAAKEEDEYSRRDHLMLIESLARQIKDAKLFEKTRIASWDKLSTAALIDIAQVYLESEEVETAHSWLKKIPGKETFQADKRDKLLLEIYQKQGDTKKLTALLYQKFRSHHSMDTLETLLDVIGNDKREKVLFDEITFIHEGAAWQEQDARFFIAIEKIDEAEAYLLKRADQLNGDFYDSLIPLAKIMVAENRHLAASLIYRSLLISILKRGYTKAYPYGVRYLKKLDTLAISVTDWLRFDTHEIFKEQIVQDHGRKRSFWSKYEIKK